MVEHTHDHLCGGCAFRAGTEANTYGPTQLTAKLCLEAGQPFFCHEARGPHGEPLLCRGFAHALVNQPSSNEAGSGQRTVASELLCLMQNGERPANGRASALIKIGADD
jgi:hypothetical protein